MLIRTITDEKDGRKWEIYKKSENEFFYKYYEFFKKGGHNHMLSVTKKPEQINFLGHTFKLKDILSSIILVCFLYVLTFGITCLFVAITGN